MKFGKYIQQHAHLEWAQYYMNYKALKKIISAAENSQLQKTDLASGKPTIITVHAQPPDYFADDLDANNENVNTVDPSTESPLPTSFKTAKTLFFFRLERELDKVNTFYLRKENELQMRLQSLMDKKRALNMDELGKTGRITTSSLNEAFLNFQDDLNSLQQFVETNATGFRKILKKWDKRSKSQTKELYISRQIDIQPCFNSDVLAELSDAVLNSLAELKGSQATSPHITETVLEAEDDKTSFSSNDAEIAFVKKLQTTNVANLTSLIEKVAGEDPHFIQRVFWILCSPTSFHVHEDTIQLLLSYNRSIDYTDDVSDRTYVHEAARSGNMTILKMCIKHGANLECSDIYGRKPLHYAVIYGHVEVTGLLLKANASASSVDHEGCSPLVHAIVNGNVACIQLLLDYGAPVNVESISDQVPLSLACQYGHLEITKLLLSRGAKLVPNVNGLYPLHVACEQGHHDIAKLLIEQGAEINVRDKYNGWSALFFAASEGHLQCVNILLHSNCSVDTLDEFGWSARTYALWNGHVGVAERLIQFEKEFPQQASMPSVFDKMPPLSLEPSETDMEGLPDLSLPPPLIPIYGHNYLEKQYQYQIVLGHPSYSSKPPVKIFGTRRVSSLRLKVSQQSSTDQVARNLPYTVTLPSQEDFEVMTFSVDSANDFCLQFDIYHAFSNKIIGRAAFLAHQFALTQSLRNEEYGIYSRHMCTAPLFDSHLRVIGEISFEFSFVKPYFHPKMDLGDIGTYWKSTTQVIPSHSRVPSANVTGAEVTMNSSPKVQNINAEMGASLVVATSLAHEYLHVVVQLTEDRIPVVYRNWFVPVRDEIKLPVSFISEAQFKHLRTKPMDWNVPYDQLSDRLSHSFITLTELLMSLPSSLGVDVEVKYPYYAKSNGPPPKWDVNTYVETILHTVYDNLASTSTPHARRSIIFSSFNPIVCNCLNLKQPNFPVLLMTHCGTESPSDETNLHGDSLKIAVRNAKSSNLLGIICAAKVLVSDTALINTIKEAGLTVGSFGEDNTNAAMLEIQEENHVDGIMVNGIYRVLNKSSI